jgi:SAM-dependent methyltransferase
LDPSRASASRIYDYLLGGSQNFKVDREVAEQMLQLVPEAAEAALANRSFLRRAVRALIDAGIRQFLDIGSGIPTLGNVHEIAHRHAPNSRVVYVDNDPVAVAHSAHILGADKRYVAIQGDLRDPAEILGNPRVQDLIDLSAPLGILLVAVLHFVPDEDDPMSAVGRLRDAAAPGSHLVISHAGWPADITPQVAEARQTYERTPTPMVVRTQAQIGAFFEGFRLVEPGLVTVARWRPEPGTVPGSPPRTDRVPAYAGVGVKPEPGAGVDH